MDEDSKDVEIVGEEKPEELDDEDVVYRLCCTNSVRDSSSESSVVAGGHEQTHPPRLQDQELAGL